MIRHVRSILTIAALAAVVPTACVPVVNPDYAYHLALWSKCRLIGDRAKLDNDLVAAAQNYRSALSEAQQLGKGDLRLAGSLYDLASVYAAQHRDTDAEQLYKQSIQMLEERREPADFAVETNAISRQLALCQSGLADLYRFQRRLPDALIAYERAKRIQEPQWKLIKGTAGDDVLGEQLTSTLFGLARTYEAIKDFARAETAYKQAVETAELSTVPHAMAESLVQHYTQFLQKRHQGKQAEELGSALNSQEPAALRAAEGQAQAEARWAQVNEEGNAFARKLDYEHALQKYYECLRIAQNKEEIGFSKRAIGLTYLSQGNLKLAERELSQAASLILEACGTEHLHSGLVQRELATCYRRQGKYAQAEGAYEACLAVWELHGSEYATETMNTFRIYAEMLRQMGKREKAKRVDARAKEFMAKVTAKAKFIMGVGK